MSESPKTEACVALNYTNLYDKQVDAGFIKDILKRFAVYDWLCH